MVIHCTHSTFNDTFFSQHWKKQGPLNSRVRNSTSNKSLNKPTKSYKEAIKVCPTNKKEDLAFFHQNLAAVFIHTGALTIT